MNEQRHTADTITDDELDALYRKIEVAEQTDKGQSTFKWYADDAQRRLKLQRERAEQAEAAIDRARALATRWAVLRAYGSAATELREALAVDAGPGTDEPQAEKTTRVTRVTALYEQWVRAGAPPLGTSMARWWDARLVELHDAILPPTTTEK